MTSFVAGSTGWMPAYADHEATTPPMPEHDTAQANVYLRLKELRAMLNNRSRSAIYADLAAGRLPKPIKFGQKSSKVYWIKSEVEAYLRDNPLNDTMVLKNYVTFKQLRAMLNNRSRQSIYIDMARGRLPKPIKSKDVRSAKLYWVKSEVEEYVRFIHEKRNA